MCCFFWLKKKKGTRPKLGLHLQQYIDDLKSFKCIYYQFLNIEINIVNPCFWFCILFPPSVGRQRVPDGVRLGRRP